MEQIKTYSDQRLDLYCAFCGGTPDTRDHIPSKILLEKPFPENLPVVPACFKCNHSFSLDEEYVACLIECSINGTTETSKLSRKKIANILSEKPQLQARLERAKIEYDGTIFFEVEHKRVENVVLKLAQGHSRYENSETQFDEPFSIWFRSLETMSESEQNSFLSVEEMTLLPEIGSRACQRVMIDDQGIPKNHWKTVQQNNYHYLISHVEAGVRVRIIIWEYLACEVVWD